MNYWKRTILLNDSLEIGDHVKVISDDFVNNSNKSGYIGMKGRLCFIDKTAVRDKYLVSSFDANECIWCKRQDIKKIH